MIRTIGALLEEILGDLKEEAKEKSAGVTHAPTIGEIYEGLTAKILDIALPPDLDLRVVKGFVRKPSGKLTLQFDRMLVYGDGELLPNINIWIYPPESVIAVFEVKKTLTAAKLAEGLETLATVEEIGEGLPLHKSFDNAYRHIVREVSPSYHELKSIDYARRAYFGILARELTSPLRILVGYEGYSTEFGLRKGFVNYIEANLNSKNIVIPRLPNLILCGANSILMQDGQPFFVSSSVQGWWPVFTSSHKLPWYYLLELILTRLSIIFNFSLRALDDLVVDSSHGLLLAQPQQIDGKSGWGYQVIDASRRELTKQIDLEWSPIFVSEAASQFLFVLVTLGELEVVDEKFEDYLADFGIDKDSLLSEVYDTGLTYRVDNLIMPLYEKLHILMLPDGRHAVSETLTGRMGAWLKKELGEEYYALAFLGSPSPQRLFELQHDLGFPFDGSMVIDIDNIDSLRDD